MPGTRFIGSAREQVASLASHAAYVQVFSHTLVYWRQLLAVAAPGREELHNLDS